MEIPLIDHDLKTIEYHERVYYYRRQIKTIYGLCLFDPEAYWNPQGSYKMLTRTILDKINDTDHDLRDKYLMLKTAQEILFNMNGSAPSQNKIIKLMTKYTHANKTVRRSLDYLVLCGAVREIKTKWPIKYELVI